ncbi:MAG: restriction endonuclease subunit S, partial [Treponema sp.]|nr:restriction endonuclease subunit S [Treponema sp.]
MTKLDRLTAKLCPNGVEYKTLGEIATEMYRGSGIKREQITKTGTPCVRYGEIYTTYNIWFDKCVSFTNEKKIIGKKYFGHGDILFAITGENVEEIAKSCVYIGDDKCLAGGDIVIMKHKQNPKYLAYALSTFNAQQQKSKGRVKSKVVHSSVPAIKSILVPIPPLPIQQEIVRILDKFTQLEAELEAELEARKKQYEYYRNTLLTFDKKSATINKTADSRQQTADSRRIVHWMTLGEVTMYSKMRIEASKLNSDNYVGVDN